MRSKFATIFSWIKEHWKLLLVLLIVLAAGGWWFLGRTNASAKKLTFIRPERRNLVKTLEISGVVDAREKARLRFAAGGKVVYLGVKEGDSVKKWQTIATIDRAALQKQLQEDLNLYMKERHDWEQTVDDTKYRSLDTRENRTVQKEQLDLNNSVLNVEIQDIAIKNTVLSAPFAGIVTVSPAATTGIQLLSTDYFEIVNPDSLEFVADVDEADIAKVQSGQKATLILDAYPDDTLTTFVGPISFASKQGENGTVFEVKFMLNPAEFVQPLRLGLNGDIAIELASRDNAISVPVTATRQRDDKTYVDVKTGEKTYEEREITVGLETDEYIEVKDGLREDEEVLSPE